MKMRYGTDTAKGKTIAVSGAGNVAIYAIRERLQQLGGKAGCSALTPHGCIYDPERHRPRIVVETIKEVEESKTHGIRRPRRPGATVSQKAARRIWSVKSADVALPCATQNELDDRSR